MSLSGPAIKKIIKMHTSKGRAETGLFIAEGMRTVLTLIQAGYKPVDVYLTPEHESFTGHLRTIPYLIIPEDLMKRISPSTTPSGIFGLFTMPENPSADTLSAGIVLAQISDPGNMGTLIRSCAAFGYSSVVVVEGCDPFSPKVIQATAGSLGTIKLFQWSWQELLDNKKNIPLCALVAQGGKEPQQALLADALLVVGNEAHGIPAPWLAQCDASVTLPIANKVESLNAAIAGSIALFLGSTPKS